MWDEGVSEEIARQQTSVVKAAVVGRQPSERVRVGGLMQQGGPLPLYLPPVGTAVRVFATIPATNVVYFGHYTQLGRWRVFVCELRQIYEIPAPGWTLVAHASTQTPPSRS